MVRKVDMAKVVAQFDSMLQLNGSDAEVVLRDGTAFTVRASDIARRPMDMTDGLQQDRLTVRVMGDRWHAAAGTDRRPEKGDRINIGGTRYAVQSAREARMQDVLVGYVILLRG